MLSGEVDFAVHSFKDVPVTMPLVEAAQKLVIVCVPVRKIRAMSDHARARAGFENQSGRRAARNVKSRRRCQVAKHF